LRASSQRSCHGIHTLWSVRSVWVSQSWSGSSRSCSCQRIRSNVS